MLRARTERRTGNPPEVALWRGLRTRPGGFKFRRQHPLGPYCLDFACLSARLAIEIDGEIHERSDRPARDSRRDEVVTGFGFATVRIPAREVLADVAAVTALIVETCRSRLPLHHSPSASGPPSPCRGG